MAKQSIMNKSDLTNFLDSGAILQVGADQYKLLLGPFKPEPFDLALVSGEKTCLYKPDFWDFLRPDQSLQKAFVGTHEFVIGREQLLDLLNQQEHVDLSVDWKAVNETDFLDQFDWSQSQFKTGQLSKTVPIISQIGTLLFSKPHLVKTLISVLSENHYGSTYGFWQNTKGFLGHTPELILEWHAEDHVINTMALAGTLPSGQQNVAAILNDPKILDEHQIVVNDLLGVLQKVNPAQEIKVEKLKVLELKFLCHLQTSIHLPGVDVMDVKKYIQAIHPTAALGLFPRKSSAYQEFKKFTIQSARENFAAPFAFIHKNQIKAVAAIRLFYFDASGVKMTSGCGVTAGSVLTDELKELENKRNSVKRMMGMNV